MCFTNPGKILFIACAVSQEILLLDTRFTDFPANKEQTSIKLSVLVVYRAVADSDMQNQTCVILIVENSDVDPDPVGSAFIWIRGSGSGSTGIKPSLTKSIFL